MEIRFWTNQSGQSPVEKFIEQLPEKTKVRILTFHLKNLEQEGLKYCTTQHMEKLKGYDLYEIKERSSSLFLRLLLTIDRETAWILHIFKKEKNFTPKKEIKTALSRKKSLN